MGSGRGHGRSAVFGDLQEVLVAQPAWTRQSIDRSETCRLCYDEIFIYESVNTDQAAAVRKQQRKTTRQTDKHA